MDPDTRLRYHEAEGVFLGWCLMVMLIVGIGFLIIRIILEIKWRHIHSRQEVIDFFLAGAPLTRPIFRFQNHPIPRVVPNTPDVSETASGFQNPVYELANANPTAAAV